MFKYCSKFQWYYWYTMEFIIYLLSFFSVLYFLNYYTNYINRVGDIQIFAQIDKVLFVAFFFFEREREKGDGKLTLGSKFSFFNFNADTIWIGFLNHSPSFCTWSGSLIKQSSNKLKSIFRNPACNCSTFFCETLLNIFQPAQIDYLYLKDRSKLTTQNKHFAEINVRKLFHSKDF